MKEAKAIVEAWTEARRSGQEAVLATVVKVEGSAYRRPGARLLLLQDGGRVGSVSGGCLEDEVARKAWWLTSEGRPSLVRYDTRGEEEERPFGLGCEGVVHVLLERLRPGEPVSQLTLIEACQQHRRPGVLATVIASIDGARARVGDRVVLGPDGTVSGELADAALTRAIARDAATCLARGRSERHSYGAASVLVEVFFEVVHPPKSLLVFGAGNDAMPVVRLAKELGWHVTVADGRAHYARRERFPLADEVVVIDPRSPLGHVSVPAGAGCVVMTHSADQDRALLVALATLPLAYLGVLGPRHRTERLLADIGPATFACSTGLHSPVGLDLGSETPEEIALAIIAEAQASMADCDGRRLRDRADGRIHAPSAQALDGATP